MAGYNNSITSVYATVSGGSDNKASNNFASVGGGLELSASADDQFLP